MDQLISLLRKYLANSVVFASTAHGFHWNVEGPMFTEYHEFFGEIYEDVDGTIDTFAEWLRKFDVQSPYTLQQFMDAQSFGEVLTNSNSPIVMSRMLYVMNERMINDSKEMFDVATLLKEQGLANFLADRQAAHEKWGWFLRSVIKQTIN